MLSLIFHAKCCRLWTFFNSSRNTIRLSNSLDPDQGSNCLQRLSADDKSHCCKEKKLNCVATKCDKDRSRDNLGYDEKTFIAVFV